MQNLVCPNCGQRTKTTVVDTRQVDGKIRRTRRCDHCLKRYTTIEVQETFFNAVAGVDQRLKEDKLLEILRLVYGTKKLLEDFGIDLGE
jgi:transcriptional regulator NrdR family protein